MINSFSIEPASSEYAARLHKLVFRIEKQISRMIAAIGDGPFFSSVKVSSFDNTLPNARAWQFCNYQESRQGRGTLSVHVYISDQACHIVEDCTLQGKVKIMSFDLSLLSLLRQIPGIGRPSSVTGVQFLYYQA
jgi:hypothetical protein